MSSSVGVVLSLLAGLATGAGGLLVVIKNDFKPQSLTFGMSAAAGVMTYLTFVEIFPEVRRTFDAAFQQSQTKLNPNILAISACGLTYFIGWFSAQLLHYMLDKAAIITNRRLTSEADPLTPDKSDTRINEYDLSLAGVSDGRGTLNDRKASTGCAQIEKISIALAEELFYKDHIRICRVGWFTTFALLLHNIPEGIATYTAYTANPKIGVGIAMAIAIHNIPEGIAVAIPIYFATRNRRTAVLMALGTGFAEPLGAILAWTVFGGEPNQLTLGIVLGLICGTMGYVALKELFFGTARYDPLDHHATNAFVLGMAFMALSLVLLEVLSPF